MNKLLTAALLSMLLLVHSANAAIITSTLGNDSSSTGFTNGQSLGFPDFFLIVDFGTGTNGFDTGSNLVRSWQHNFGAITDAILSATFTIGVYDHDSASAGDQLDALTLDGTDNTASLNGLFELSGGTNAEYNEYTFSLGAFALADLLDGLFNVDIALKGPVFSPGLFGGGVVQPNNGARIVFSTLTITTQAVNPNPNPVPAPGALLMLLVGLTLLCVRKIKNI